MAKLKPGSITKWLARGLALILAAFWGSFFVEHLLEWFLRADGQYPPPRVWVAMASHFAMIAGLLAMLKWDKAGTAILMGGTLAFLVAVGDGDVVPICLINLIPVAAFALYWRVRKN
ncbi:MAG: hypothetical protein K6T61_00670 [Bryobacteraceae bacterium]|nr:hypothetical protein [Bryobacteraceae bacterium]